MYFCKPFPECFWTLDETSRWLIKEISKSCPNIVEQADRVSKKISTAKHFVYLDPVKGFPALLLHGFLEFCSVVLCEPVIQMA